MVFESLKTSTVNLPVVGAVSLAAILVAGGIIFFLSRRKKTIGIRIWVL